MNLVGRHSEVSSVRIPIGGFLTRLPKVGGPATLPCTAFSRSKAITLRVSSVSARPIPAYSRLSQSLALGVLSGVRLDRLYFAVLPYQKRAVDFPFTVPMERESGCGEYFNKLRSSTTEVGSHLGTIHDNNSSTSFSVASETWSD